MTFKEQEKGQEELVVAEAVLMPIGDLRKVSREIGNLHVDRNKIARATEAFKQLGFTVIEEGIVSISILGRRKLFEKVFQVELRKQQKVKQQSDTGYKTNSELAISYYYLPDKKINIPEKLEGLISDLLFEREPIKYT
jgi:hypothetical protein